MRIGVLSHSQKLTDRPERYVSKTAANALVRRALAVKHTKLLIQLVAIRAFVHGLPARVETPPTLPAIYEHHIEPKIIPLTLSNSLFRRYMEGF